MAVPVPLRGSRHRVRRGGVLDIRHQSMSQEIPKPSPESEEKQLCLSCMAPNEPTAHFCAKCGAPLSSYASTGPFESLFSEGAVYRQAAERPRSFIVVLGIWLIF